MPTWSLDKNSDEWVSLIIDIIINWISHFFTRIFFFLSTSNHVLNKNWLYFSSRTTKQSWSDSIYICLDNPGYTQQVWRVYLKHMALFCPHIEQRSQRICETESIVLLLFCCCYCDVTTLKRARTPEKLKKENPAGCAREGKQCKGK